MKQVRPSQLLHHVALGPDADGDRAETADEDLQAEERKEIHHPFDFAAQQGLCRILGSDPARSGFLTILGVRQSIDSRQMRIALV